MIFVFELRELIKSASYWWAAPTTVVLRFHTIEQARQFREALGLPEPKTEGPEDVR